MGEKDILTGMCSDTIKDVTKIRLHMPQVNYNYKRDSCNCTRIRMASMFKKDESKIRIINRY